MAFRVSSSCKKKSFSKTNILSSGPNEFCDRLGLLLQEKKAVNNFELINDEIVAIADKLIDYKHISQKQNRHLLVKCNLLHEYI